MKRGFYILVWLLTVVMVASCTKDGPVVSYDVDVELSVVNTNSSATVSGSVSSVANISYIFVEISSNQSFDQSLVYNAEYDGSAFSVDIPDLQPSTTYYCRLLVQNAYSVLKSASFEVVTTAPDKCNFDDYKWVAIGTQVWMAENYRCSYYATESEAYDSNFGKHRLRYITDRSSNPGYTDATNSECWDNPEDASSLSEDQRLKLGYLYNWAAALGLQSSYYTYEATPRRQGICPNGSHLPSEDEWNQLLEYLGSDSHEATKLKSSTGWYNDESTVPGTDNYRFEALPAGIMTDNLISSVGKRAYFFVLGNTPSKTLWTRYIYYNSEIVSFTTNNQNFALSVRCVKN